jgi:hypothetical protein
MLQLAPVGHARGASPPQCAATSGLHAPLFWIGTPAFRAMLVFQYVTPSHPHCGSRAGCSSVPFRTQTPSPQFSASQ